MTISRIIFESSLAPKMLESPPPAAGRLPPSSLGTGVARSSASSSASSSRHRASVVIMHDVCLLPSSHQLLLVVIVRGVDNMAVAARDDGASRGTRGGCPPRPFIVVSLSFSCLSLPPPQPPPPRLTFALTVGSGRGPRAGRGLRFLCKTKERRCPPFVSRRLYSLSSGK